MKPEVSVFIAFLGIVVTAVVNLLLGRRKSTVDADGVVVSTADKLIELLRADMLAVRHQLVEQAGELASIRMHVRKCEEENEILRHRVIQLENVNNI